MQMRGRATLRLLGTLAISTLVTGFIELVASKYASSVTLGADSLHMVLDAFVYTLNYIAEQKHQNLAQTKKHRQMLDDGRFCSNVFSDLSKETRKLLSEHSDVEQRSSLAQDELLLTLSPRSLQNDAIEAQMALNAVHWEVASSCVTGIVLLGSPLYIATVSVQKFLTAIQGPSHASIVEEKMDNSLLFYAGILGFCLHSIALVTFLFVPELQQLNPALILGRSIGHRDWDKGGGCHTDTHANALADEQMLGEFKGTSIQGLHLSATLFHILSDIMENLGLLVALLLIKLNFHPALVDASASIVISCAVMVMATCLLRLSLPAFCSTFFDPTISESIPVDPNRTLYLTGDHHGKKIAHEL
ncbi:hypothetical protein AAMO2058_001171300 [Amorphochlora amoebiformis]